LTVFGIASVASVANALFLAFFLLLLHFEAWEDPQALSREVHTVQLPVSNDSGMADAPASQSESNADWGRADTKTMFTNAGENAAPQSVARSLHAPTKKYQRRKRR
jgi:hypothetical protein